MHFFSLVALAYEKGQSSTTNSKSDILLETESNAECNAEVLLGDYSTTVELKIASTKEVYNPDGTVGLQVAFVSDDLSDKMECIIPKEVADKIDRNAVYLANIKIEYINSIFNDYLSSGGTGVQDFIKLQSDWCSITDIDFMFSDYISSNFKTTEELKADFQKNYKTLKLKE